MAWRTDHERAAVVIQVGKLEEALVGAESKILAQNKYIQELKAEMAAQIDSARAAAADEIARIQKLKTQHL